MLMENEKDRVWVGEEDISYLLAETLRCKISCAEENEEVLGQGFVEYVSGAVEMARAMIDALYDFRAMQKEFDALEDEDLDD